MNPRERAFTLLELLIALALVGMMTLLMYGALDFGGRAWDRGEAATEREAETMLVWSRLSGLFLSAGTRAVRPSAGREGAFPLRGDPRGVEFIASMPGPSGAGLYLVRLETERKGEQQRLLLRRWLYHPEVLDDPDALAGPGRDDTPASGFWYAESVLVEHLDRVRFAYHDAGAGEGWQDRWQEPARLPALVRMEVEDSRGRWPVMIFELPQS